MPQDVTRRAQEGHRQAVAAGQHLVAQLDMTDVEVDGADLAVEMQVGPELSNSRGALLGGLIATLADVVAGRLAMDSVEPGQTTPTTDLTIRYLAPIVQGPARAEGRILRRGKHSVVVSVDIRDVATDRLAAVSTVAFAVLGSLPE